jgi:hypothetical protein
MAAVLEREKKDEAKKANDMDASRKVKYQRNTRNLSVLTHSLADLGESTKLALADGRLH